MMEKLQTWAEAFEGIVNIYKDSLANSIENGEYKDLEDLKENLREDAENPAFINKSIDVDSTTGDKK